MWVLCGVILGSLKESQRARVAEVAVSVIEKELEGGTKKTLEYALQWLEVRLLIASGVVSDVKPEARSGQSVVGRAIRVLEGIAGEVQKLHGEERGDLPTYLNRAANHLYIKTGFLIFETSLVLVKFFIRSLRRRFGPTLPLYSLGWRGSCTPFIPPGFFQRRS